MAEAGKRYVQDNFSWNKVIEKYVGLIDSISGQ